MGVKVTHGQHNESHLFNSATEWYVTDERVLQIYQPHDGNNEFVIAEYNAGFWSAVEHCPPLPPDPRKPENEETSTLPQLGGFPPKGML